MNILLPRMRKKKHTYTSLSNDYATMNHFSYNNTYKILLALFKCNFTALSELKLINPSNKKQKERLLLLLIYASVQLGMHDPFKLFMHIL